MMRSLSSAVTGLKAQQTAMDVLGNNIANVNTAGFKTSSTQFEDLFYQTLSGGTAETNPSQVGYGTQVSGVSKNMASSGATTTSKSTDLYIDGSGYFALSSSKEPTATDTKDSAGNTITGIVPTSYTRVGNFSFDSKGYLVDSSGNYVLSSALTDSTAVSPDQTATFGQPICICLDSTSTSSDIAPTFEPTDGSTGTAIISSNYSDLSDISFNTDGTISASLGGVTGTICSKDDSTSPWKVGLASFVNENGLSQVGDNDYSSNSSSGTATAMTAGMNGSSTKIRSDQLESSNVDISTEFTNMIITQRGFQANSRVITTSDTMLEELVNLKRS